MDTPEEIAVSRELLESDLETLFKLIVTYRKPVSEGDIRAASAILRRWLCEGMIGKLANKLGVTPTFPVLDNNTIFDALKCAPDVNYYLTGGIRMNGFPVSSVYDSSTKSPADAGVKAGPLPTVMMTSGRMCRQPRLFHAGEQFTCEQIIRFTANKLGGVHLDFERDPREAQLDRAARHMTFGGDPQMLERGKPGVLHLALEPTGREALSGIYLEVIAASASLLNVHFDGKPLMQFVVRKSLVAKLRQALGLKRRPSGKLFDGG